MRSPAIRYLSISTKVLVRSGITELSAAPRFVPELKASVRRLRTDACRALADRALALDSADAVRALVRDFLKEHVA